MADWMIYGASGYTGALVAEEAVRRGHKPLLAGRSDGKVRRLAQKLDLDYLSFGVNDAAAVANAISRVGLVYNAAGPFVHTGKPIMDACLAAGAHYLDINGEIPLYQYAFSLNEAVQQKGIAILPGIGFDVLPSDCLVKYVADQLPDATHLDVALDILSASNSPTGGLSAGTAKSTLDLMVSTGDQKRVDGKLVPITFGSGVKRFHLSTGEKAAAPMPWGDLEMGYRTTGIPNITTYMAFPPAMMLLLHLTGWALPALLSPRFVRDFLEQQIDQMISGPNVTARERGRAAIYASVRNAKGETRQAWMETPEAYQFTVVAGVRVVERVLNGNFKGALTPSKAFGADFPLEIEGTKRWDSPPK